MVKKMKYIIALITIISIGLGQLKSDLSQNNAIFNNPVGSNGSILALFDPNQRSYDETVKILQDDWDGTEDELWEIIG